MTTRLRTLIAVALLTLLASAAELRAQSEVVYQQNFDSFSTRSGAPGWIDSVVGPISARRRAVRAPGGSIYRTNADPVDAHNVVFGAANAVGDEQGSRRARFGTFSTLSSTTFAQTLDFSGRIFRGSPTTLVGLSFFSSYPEKDRYYLIALAPQPGGKLTMQLFAYGAGTLIGNIDSGFTPDPNIWYRFHIVVDASGSDTAIRANFWRDGTNEPAADTISASDSDARRLRSGHIGMWSAIDGSAFVDDLVARSSVPVGGIDTTPPSIAIYEGGTLIDPSSRPSFGHDVAFDIRVQDESAFSVTSTLDDSPYTSLSTVSTEGTHTLHVTAMDVFGNIGQVTLAFTIVRITSQPAIAITTPASNALVGSAHLAVSGTVENAATVTVNGVAAHIDLTAKTFTAPDVALLEGPNTLTAIAANSVGVTATATSSVIVDTRAPELTITAPAASACLDVTSIDVRGQALDPSLRSVKIIVAGTSIDAAVIADGSWSAAVPATARASTRLSMSCFK